MKLSETTLHKLERGVNAQYVKRLTDAFKEKFSASLETSYSIFEMRYVSNVEGLTAPVRVRG